MKLNSFYPILVLLFLCVSFGRAQKIKQKTITFDYIRQPFFQLPAKVETYEVKVHLNKFVRDFYNSLGRADSLQTEYRQSVILDGYGLVKEKGDIWVEIDLKTTRPFKVVNKIHKGSETVGQGEEAKSYPYTAYYKQIEYGKASVKLVMRNDQGIFLEREMAITVPDNYKIFGSKGPDNYYPTPLLREKSWKKGKIAFLNRIASITFGSLSLDISEIFSEFCLRKRSHQLELEIIQKARGKQEHTYEDYDQALASFEEGLKMIGEDSIITTNKFVQPKYEESTKKIQEAIQIWEKMLEEEDPKKESARVNKKIGRTIRYNLAKAYTWLEDYAKAEEYFQIRLDEGNALKNIGKGIRNFEKFLLSQRYRSQQNKWRQVYTTPEEAQNPNSPPQPDGIYDTEINYAQPASLYIYCDGDLFNSGDYTVYLNNQPLGANLTSGEGIIYEIYSRGFLLLSLSKVDSDGLITRPQPISQIISQELLDMNLSQFMSVQNAYTYNALTGFYNPSISQPLTMISPLSAVVSDINYRSINKGDIILDVQPGAHYYLRISAADNAIRQKDEMDGEQEFYRRETNAILLEEDIYNPIPSMSIFNARIQGLDLTKDLTTIIEQKTKGDK